MYQCWDKTDKTGISTGLDLYQSANGFQVSLWEATECVKPGVKPSSIDNNIGIASFCLIIISFVCKMLSFF